MDGGGGKFVPSNSGALAIHSRQSIRKAPAATYLTWARPSSVPPQLWALWTRPAAPVYSKWPRQPSHCYSLRTGFWVICECWRNVELWASAVELARVPVLLLRRVIIADWRRGRCFEEDLQRSRRKKSENTRLESSWFSFMIDFLPYSVHVIPCCSFPSVFSVIYFQNDHIMPRKISHTIPGPALFYMRCVASQTFLATKCINHCSSGTFVIIVVRSITNTRNVFFWNDM